MKMPQDLNKPKADGAYGSQSLGTPVERNATMMAQDPTLQERRSTFLWGLRLGAVSAAAVGLYNVVAFLQTDVWQMFALASATLVALLGLLPAAWFGRRAFDPREDEQPPYETTQFQVAAYWILGAMLFVLGAANLLYEGLTPHLTVGGMLLTLILGILFLPSKWRVWLAAMAAYGVLVLLLDLFEPLPRYNVAYMNPQAGSLGLALLGFLMVAALWAILRAYRRIMAIRLRLLLSSALVVLLTAVVVATALVVVGSRNGRQQAINQLEAIANIKQSEIDNWLAEVRSDLGAVVGDTEVMPRALILLKNPGLSPAQEFFTWSYLRQVVAQTPRLEALSLLDQSGHLVLSTAADELAEALGEQPVFEQGLQGFYLQPPAFSPAEGRTRILAARPVVDEDGQTYGVVVGSVAPSSLSEILGQRAWVGETGELYLVDGQGYLLSELRHAGTEAGGAAGSSEGAASAPGQAGSSTVYSDYRGVAVVGTYRWLPELELTLVAKQDMAEALSLTNSLLQVVALASLAAFAVAVVASLVVTRSITQPLADLTEVSERIAGGDLSLRAPVASQDEVGILAQRFNSMTNQMRDLIGTLEERVAERTQELERRSTFLEASSEIGRATSSILEPDRLIQVAVELVQTRFEPSSVALFLADSDRGWAVLQAGSLKAGDVLLERGYRIPVGESAPAPTGWCIYRGQARVLSGGSRGEAAQTSLAPQSGATAHPASLRSPGPARSQLSEAALPLRSRGQVLGALTVQDGRPDAFDEETMAALQMIADQVAVALDNAQLFVRSQQALEAERRAYGQFSRDAWMELIRGRRTLGYRCDREGVRPLSDVSQTPLGRMAVESRTQPDPPGALPEDQRAEIAMPIVVRDQTIGTLVFSKETEAKAGRTWSDDEVALMRAMVEELGQALESARLYQDTQRRAAREQTIRQVTEQMRRAVDVEAILQSTVVELAKAMGAPRAYVRLGTELGPRPDSISAAEPAGEPDTKDLAPSRPEPSGASQPEPTAEGMGVGGSKAARGSDARERDQG
jgi:GAF domain-containing protein/HAMP domain-containing protein